MNGKSALVYFSGLTLALGLAAPGQGFFSSAHSPKITVLWVPAENFSQWNELDGLLERYKDLRFTIAVAPEDVPSEAAKKLSAWSAAGRIELALRLQGDPILPLIADHPAAPRPKDVLDRLALSRETFKTLFGVPPAGFSAGGGALEPSMFPSFGALGLAWVACGDYAGSSTSWTSAGQTVLIPLKTARPAAGDLAPEDLSLPDYSRPDAFVVDEADGLVPDGSWLRLLRILSDKHPHPNWGTLSEAAGERRSAGFADAASVAAWPTWAGSTALWSAPSAARKAWKIYGDTALALARYQNSGVAELKDLEEASGELYLAQTANYYRLLSEPQSPAAVAADRELRAHLTAVYRKMKQTPPEELFSPIISAPSAGPQAAGDDRAPGSTDVHFTQGDFWLAFDNPAGSLGRAPVGERTLADGTRPEELWKILGLRVEWTGQGVTFVYRMAKLDNAQGAPQELGALLLDTYIDLNHTSGAGSVELLPGRPGVLVARDAWEYALTVSGWGAFLYRSNPLGSPQLAGKLTMSVEPKTGEIKVAVPDSLIKGNPQRWGYAVLAMAVDPDTTLRPPPRPAADAAGGAVLGLLAPLEQQNALRADSARPRLTALRARGNP